MKRKGNGYHIRGQVHKSQVSRCLEMETMRQAKQLPICATKAVVSEV